MPKIPTGQQTLPKILLLDTSKKSLFHGSFSLLPNKIH